MPLTKQPLMDIPVLVIRDQVVFPGLSTTLHVSRDRSRIALKSAMKGGRIVCVVTQLDMSVAAPGLDEIASVGSLCEILHEVPHPDGSSRVSLRSLERIKLGRVEDRGGFYRAEVKLIPYESTSKSLEVEAKVRLLKDAFLEICASHKSIPPSSIDQVIYLESPDLLVNNIVHLLPLSPRERQSSLDETDAEVRIENALRAISREREILEIERIVREQVESEIATTHREFLLKEQLNAINEQLEEIGSGEVDPDGYLARLRSIQLPTLAFETADRQIKLLAKTQVGSPESTTVRNFLDTLLELPWSVESPDEMDRHLVETTLDAQHYGLSVVKERILDFLAVKRRNPEARGTVLCFSGPPGVGKTSVAKSIALALGRKCSLIALGGIHDESEIRGHRRAYVGAMPGRIINALKECGSRNPVIILDEIDKISSNGRADPSSALLEVFDPSQNSKFLDHYLDIPFDLTKVLFIATANVAGTIPHALRDRLEIIEFPGYTDSERVKIAERHIWPSVLETCKFHDGEINLEQGVFAKIADEYTRESGVRQLSRELHLLGRKLARSKELHPDSPLEVNLKDLITLLGPSHNPPLAHQLETPVGFVHGLVVSQHGGDLMEIEIAFTEKAGLTPELTLTGSMGSVMQESAQAAFTCVKQLLAEKRDLLNARSKKTKKSQSSLLIPSRKDLHIHMTQGGIPKDGPSAGMAIAVAIVSAITGTGVRGSDAMTGEISLRGYILPVGGVREKLLAAKRLGIKRVFLPRDNFDEVKQFSHEVTGNLEIIPVKTLQEAISFIFD